MVEFSPLFPMFMPIFFIPKDNKDSLDHRDNGDYCIAEGDFILECNEVSIHPITELLQENPFSTLVDEAQLCESITKSPSANHLTLNKEVCDHLPLLEYYQKKTKRGPKEVEVIYDEEWLFGFELTSSQVLHTTQIFQVFHDVVTSRIPTQREK